jgi:putative sigma-54 modulation protein
MIRLEISGVHFELDDKLTKYVERKIGGLDRYVPRKARSALHARVVLVEEEGNQKNRFTCEATLQLPHEVVIAKEATINIYAAVDIVEAKLKHQLQKYKSKATNYRHRARLFLRRLRSASRRIGRRSEP